MNELITDQLFEGHNFAEKPLEADFEECIFRNSVFAKANLSGLSFTNCTFENCDLSGAKLLKTAIQECEFIDCKMLGLAFEACAPILFQITCTRCTLNFSSFYQVDLTNSGFNTCKLLEADFTEADLSDISLSGCDLSGATFDHTRLERTDFSSAENYTINPQLNKITGAIFGKEGLPGLLSAFNIKIV